MSANDHSRAGYDLPDADATLFQTLQALNPRPPATRRATMTRRSALLGLAGLGAGGALLNAPRAQTACAVVPTEVAGPYPGDGTNGPNVLTQSGIVRSDMRSSFGSSGTATVPGVLLNMNLQLVNTNASCQPLANYALYLWACDAAGNYSMYSAGATNLNHMRAVQVSNSNGMVNFQAIFPGCYAGRWPHFHFEVYSSLAAVTTGRNAIKTSQIALPQAESQAVYSQAANIYPASSSNLSRVTLASDGIFSDGVSLQMPTLTGSVSAGYTATLKIGIAGGTATVVTQKTVEFYNSILDHYVMLTLPEEIAAVDGGAAGPGWSRTGAVFEMEPTPGTNSFVVHRFYGSMNPGPNSHFYTISTAERDYLISLAASTPATQKRWNYESAGGFWAGLVGASGCTTNSAGYSVPVYRLYNNGFAKGIDSNHRYTTSLAIASQMQAKGWALEGMVFCAVGATAASS